MDKSASFCDNAPARRSSVSLDVICYRASSAPVMKVSDVLRMLGDDGWFLASQRGSHRQFKHPSKPGRVTVACKPSDDLAPGTFNSILKQSGLKK